MRFRFLICMLFAALLCMHRTVIAGLAPELVLLVANGDSEASLAVANEYARLRGIPDTNIVILPGVASVEQLSVDDFRTQILVPVLNAIDQRGLRSQIRCVAYSADLPTAINVSSDIGSQNLPRVLTPVASINGLTYLHHLTMARDVRYLDMNVNSYARRFGTRSADTPWQPDELKLYTDAVQRLDRQSRRPRPGNLQEQPADAARPANDPALIAAIDSLQQLRLSHPHSSELLYNLACSLAVIDRNDDALETLSAAIAAGWFDYRHAARDPDLASLHDTPAFKTLLNAMKQVRLDVLPARGFQSHAGWLPNGEPSSQPEASRYLLSTVLGITSGRGNTVEDVIACLRRSAAADGTRPKGTIYFMRNGDVRSTTREWAFASAVDNLKALGVDAVIEDGVLPQQKDQVAGAMIGTADFDWPKCASTILPGAIVEHLTSFGGVMTKGAGQTPLTEFLRHGAAGASGTVTEPYAIQNKFPNPFIHVHYARGVSLAEAFYLSVIGPYQLLVVGDPLCNPWRRELPVKVLAPSTEELWRGTVTLQPKVDLTSEITAAAITLYVDGALVKSASQNEVIELDTTKLTDGEHQVTLLASGNDAVESIGRWSIGVTVGNGGMDRRPKLVAKSGSPMEHPSEKPVEIEASCPGATEISILHLGRVVSKLTGESGTATIMPRQLGTGLVGLRPVAMFGDGKSVVGKTLFITLQPAVK